MWIITLHESRMKNKILPQHENHLSVPLLPPELFWSIKPWTPGLRGCPVKCTCSFCLFVCLFVCNFVTDLGMLIYMCSPCSGAKIIIWSPFQWPMSNHVYFQCLPPSESQTFNDYKVLWDPVEENNSNKCLRLKSSRLWNDTRSLISSVHLVDTHFESFRIRRALRWSHVLHRVCVCVCVCREGGVHTFGHTPLCCQSCADWHSLPVTKSCTEKQNKKTKTKVNPKWMNQISCEECCFLGRVLPSSPPTHNTAL